MTPPEPSRQATLDGVWIPAMPPVRRSDGHILEWDRERIVRQILVETRLVETFYDGEGADEETARAVAREVEDRIRRLNLTALSAPLIREIMNITCSSAAWSGTGTSARAWAPRSTTPT